MTILGSIQCSSFFVLNIYILLSLILDCKTMMYTPNAPFQLFNRFIIYEEQKKKKKKTTKFYSKTLESAIDPQKTNEG